MNYKIYQYFFSNFMFVNRTNVVSKNCVCVEVVSNVCRSCVEKFDRRIMLENKLLLHERHYPKELFSVRSFDNFDDVGFSPYAVYVISDGAG